MKVSLHYISGVDTLIYWLIGDPELSPRKHSPIMAETREPGRAQQIGIGGAGWAAQRHYDRGTDGLSIEGTTAITFTTEQQCVEFTNSLSRADADKPHPFEGEIHLRNEYADSSWADEIMEDAVLTITSIQRIGVMVQVRYRMSGGQLRAGVAIDGETGTYSWILDGSGNHIMDDEERFLHDEDHEA